MPFPRSFTPFLLCLALLALPATAKKKAAAEPAEKPPAKLSSETLSGLELRAIGPALMSGRIADIAVHRVTRAPGT